MADSQSFPFQSLSRPRLWRGAYPHERYTQGDVAAVVEHARLRGVRCARGTPTLSACWRTYCTQARAPSPPPTDGTQGTTLPRGVASFCTQSCFICIALTSRITT
eukprot:2733442-Pleurochrysis_carterae.AAC.2